VSTHYIFIILSLYGNVKKKLYINKFFLDNIIMGNFKQSKYPEGETAVVKPVWKSKLIKYMGIGLFAGVANGLFGSGGGTIAVPAMVYLLGEEDHMAHATALLIILPLTLVSSYFYLSNSFVDWNITWKAMLGGAAGGAIGAFLLNKFPSGILRVIFGAFMLAAAVRMIF